MSLLFTFQTTNYGLAGLCETHHDSTGQVMLDNLEMTFAKKKEIKGKGDVIATLMAWLNTPKGKYYFKGAIFYLSEEHQIRRILTF